MSSLNDTHISLNDTHISLNDTHISFNGNKHIQRSNHTVSEPVINELTNPNNTLLIKSTRFTYRIIKPYLLLKCNNG